MTRLSESCPGSHVQGSPVGTSWFDRSHVHESVEMYDMLGSINRTVRGLEVNEDTLSVALITRAMSGATPTPA